MSYYDYENLIKIKTEMIGKTFGRLKVISRGADFVDDTGRHLPTWNCECQCENHTYVENVKGIMLRQGKRKSCGCLYHPTGEMSINYKHGKSKSRLYVMYRTMKSRCGIDNPSYMNNANYIKNNIKVCDEWNNDFSAFEKWAIENGYDENAPRGECTLDRIDNLGDYCPENCRWINTKDQCNNKSNNHMIEYNGKVQSLTKWAEETGIPYSTLASRAEKGWTVEKMLTTPKIDPMMYELNGEWHTASEWSAIHGVEYRKLTKNLHKGMTLLEAIFYCKKKLKNKKFIYIDGYINPIGTYSRILNIEYHTLCDRYAALKDGDVVNSIFVHSIFQKPFNGIYFIGDDGTLIAQDKYDK